VDLKTITLFLADLHCGSITGIMTRGQWQGAAYHDPNGVQKIIRKQFDEGIESVRALRKGARLIVCLVGDMIDGNHHQTVELITPDPEEQSRIAIAVLDEALKRLKFGGQDKLYCISGTECHTGQYEEAIARDLSAVPYRSGTTENYYEDGRYTWPRLLLTVYGTRHDIAHHGGKVGKRPWTRPNQLRSTLTGIYFDALDHGTPLPRYWIRANEHQYLSDDYIGLRGTVTGIVLPALQLRTRYAHTVAGDNSMSTIGMAWTVCDENGTDWDKSTLTFDEQAETEVVL
jgi:hypothetical protein